MKCLDKKRIKMKQGETLALNERIMLSLVSTGVGQRAYTQPSEIGLLLPFIQQFRLLMLFSLNLSLSFSLLSLTLDPGLSIYCVYDVCFPYP